MEPEASGRKWSCDAAPIKARLVVLEWSSSALDTALPTRRDAYRGRNGRWRQRSRCLICQRISWRSLAHRHVICLAAPIIPHYNEFSFYFFLFFFFFNLCPKHLRISIKNQNHRLVKFNQLSRLSRNQFNSNRSTWSSSIWIEDWFREQPSHLFHFFWMIRLKFAWNGDSRWYETL